MDDKLVERIFARRTLGIKPGLETMRWLLAELGNPEKDLRIVHIAGTNGKGSVSAMVASVLEYSGIKAGLYTSPHLLRLNERFRIDGREIADSEMFPLLEEVERAALAMEAKGRPAPTFFECVTALAVLWFARSGVRLAVAEVGMGGRLDATNALPSIVSVITRIGLDHTEYLGDTIAKVAHEKAGIIKPGVPVVCGAMPAAAAEVVVRTAAEVGAPIVVVSDAVGVRRVSGNIREQKVAVSSTSEDYGTIGMKLAAAYQVENIATAVAAVETLGRVLGIEFGRKPMVKGLAAAEWIGRFQCIGDNPDMIVDGAHNPDGARALVDALKAAKCGRKARFVVGQCSDKDSAGFFSTIAPYCGALWTVPIANPRSRPPVELAAQARQCGIRRVEPCATLDEGLDLAKAEALADGDKGLVIVCGSLFLVGELLGRGMSGKDSPASGAY